MPAAFVGLDMGSSRTKIAVCNSDGQLIGHAVRKSGTDFALAAATCLDSSLQMAGLTRKDIAGAVSTGYGRANVPSITQENKTEIGCLAKGCHHYFPQAATIIDIGGQDNKIVKIDAGGHRGSFKLNRKCAAGTGAFLEEMATRLDLPLDEFDQLARQSESMVKLGSYCTVFSATEVLEHIRHGKKVPDIVKGIFYSVIRRVLEMDSLTEQVVMTGGVVAHNPYLVEMTGQMLGRSIMVPKYPQLVSAVGAALYARECAGPAEAVSMRFVS